MAAITSFLSRLGRNISQSSNSGTDPIYLGSAATNPTVDLAGDPLQSGMLYTNGLQMTDYFIMMAVRGREASPATVGALTDVVADLSPQLGVDLQSNTFDIHMADDDKVRLGTGNDLEIQHTSATKPDIRSI